MIEILKDIRSKINENAYSNEEQVRFSLVARILQALGWNIWDPNDVVTEYSVKKFPIKDISKDENGRVDIALFINNHIDRTPEVFIEIKAIKRLQGDFSSFEEQLQRYNYYDRSAISILTDGIDWKFYLPSACGSFDQRKFNEFNMIRDNTDFINNVFQEVLLKDNFRRKAIQTGERMLEEMKLVYMIRRVKEEAGKLAKTLGDSQYEIAQKILSNRYGRMISLDEIEKYWDRQIIEQVPAIQVKEEPGISVKPLSQAENNPIDLKRFNPTRQKPKRVYIFGKWYNISSWRKMYIRVCEEIIKRHPDTDLNGYGKNETIWKNGSEVQLSNGIYINACLPASRHLSSSIKVLESHGYDVNENLKIDV